MRNSNITNPLLKWSLLTVLLVLPVCSFSLTYCVTNSSEFQSALSQSASSNSFNQIKLMSGIYTVPSGGFEYDGASNSNDLWISGGWREVGGLLCAQRVTEQFDTIVNGASTDRGLLIRGSSGSRVAISNLSFAFGSASAGKGGGLFIRDANLTLEQCTFVQNTAPLGGAALNVYKGYDHIIRNNVFSHNHSTEFAGAIDIFIEDTVLGVYFTNNTVVFNDTLSTSVNASSGLIVNNINSTKAYIANNILLYNEANDLALLGNDSKYLVHNDIAFVTGSIPLNTYGNINNDPQFEEGPTYHYGLSQNSTLINSGIEPDPDFPIFPNNWSPGAFDISGSPRVQGLTIDIGAFEFNQETPIFANGFD